MLNFINVIHNYFQGLIGFVGFNLHKEFVLVLLIPNKPNIQILLIWKLLHRSTTWLLDCIWNLKAVLVNQLVLKHTNHLTQLFILLSILHYNFTKLLYSLVFADNLVFQRDDFLTKRMLWTMKFINLCFNIQFFILILQNLFI